MNEIYLFLGIVVLLNLAVLAVIFWRTKKNDPGDRKGELEILQRELQEMHRNLKSEIGESSKATHESVRHQLSESMKIVKEVTQGLTKLDETNRQVVSFADQLQNLQDILKNPKQRGILGEYYLESVLKNVLSPGQYQMQYGFKNGEIVDAVIFLQEKILCIDSKFSLENYNRLLECKDEAERERIEKEFKSDLKKRIDETSKYIRPEEGTMDFAFMFIPSEGIYYDLLINQVGAVKTSTRDLIEYAFNQKKVIIVSPTSFLAYLQTVLQGLKSLQIEEQAKEIQKRVGELGRHLSNYDEFMLSLGKSLGTTVNHYNKAYKELGKIDKDVMRISGESAELDPLVIDKPQLE